MSYKNTDLSMYIQVLSIMGTSRYTCGLRVRIAPKTGVISSRIYLAGLSAYRP